MAGLDPRHISGIDGIGAKGMANIRDWLSGLGFSLPEPPDAKGESLSRRQAHKIAHAIRLLRANGYRVERIPRDGPVDSGKG